MGGPRRADVHRLHPQERQREVVEGHFGTVREICRLLEGYPLGILPTAAQLSDEGETPEGLLERLRAGMADALQYARAADLPDRHRSVGAAMRSSYEKLGAAARQLLAHIALFPGGAGEEMLKALEGLDEAEWREAKRELQDLRLVRWEEERYRMLAPIRAWAQTTLPADEMNACRLRAARWLKEQAMMWDALLTPGEERRALADIISEARGAKAEEIVREMQKALAAFARERENLRAQVRTIARHVDRATGGR